MNHPNLTTTATTNKRGRTKFVKNIVLTGATGYLGQHLLYQFGTKGIASVGNLCGYDNSNSNDDSYYHYHIYALCRSTPDTGRKIQEAFDEDIAAASAAPKDVKNVTFEIVSDIDLTDKVCIDTWMRSTFVNYNSATSGNNNHHVVDSDNDTDLSPTIDICIHTAALSSPKLCEDDPNAASAINVPNDFFNAIYQQNPELMMIALSTDQVYNNDKIEQQQQYYFKEDDSTKQQPCNVYGQTKLQMEQVLQEISKGTAILLRSSIIAGPKTPPLLSDVYPAHDTFLHFCYNRIAMNTATTFYSDEKRCVVSLYDVIRTIEWFIGYATTADTDTTNTAISRVGGIYNMGGPETVSRYDMARGVWKYFQQTDDDLEKYVIPCEKKIQQQQQQFYPPSPLDISMDSTKLYQLTGLQFQTFPEIIQSTFNNNN